MSLASFFGAERSAGEGKCGLTIPDRNSLLRIAYRSIPLWQFEGSRSGFDVEKVDACVFTLWRQQAPGKKAANRKILPRLALFRVRRTPKWNFCKSKSDAAVKKQNGKGALIWPASHLISRGCSGRFGKAKLTRNFVRPTCLPQSGSRLFTRVRF